MLSLLAVVCLAAASPHAAPVPASTADAIMTEVGIHQDCAIAARKSFLYRQKLLLRMHRGNGKPAREERREYTVTPLESGFQKELTSFHGKYMAGGKEVSYDKPGYQYKGTDVDGQVLDEMANDFASDKDSRDGLARNMFPLTTAEQRPYHFWLKDTETYRGRKMYRIAFEPRERSSEFDGDSGPWKGEALVDAEEYQPVMIETNLASKFPFLVKTLLGTNIQGLGFSVTYQKFAPGVWFPVTYGGEFRVKVLFFYTRNISVNLENTGFQRTNVESTIEFQNQTE